MELRRRYADGEICRGALLQKSVDPSQTMEILAGTTVSPRADGCGLAGKLCSEHGIAHEPGTVDIGVRVEVRNEIMEDVNNVLV